MKNAVLLSCLAHALLWHLTLALEPHARTSESWTQVVPNVLISGARGKTERETLDTQDGILTDDVELRQLRQLSSSNGQFDCDLAKRKIERVLDADARTWRIDRAFWADINEDLQEIVNCSEEGDTLLFDVSEALQPSRPVTLPWALTLSAVVPNTSLVDGIFPETRREATFTCPPDAQGLFSVQARDVLFANLAFENCSLDTEQSAAIIEVERCDADGPQGSVRLHHVKFSRNQLKGAVAVLMNEESCSALEMVDVLFENNTCSGYCGAVLSSRNDLADVQIRGNTQAGASTIPAIFFAPSASQTTLRRMVAVANTGPIVHVNRGELEMFDSLLSQNVESAGPAKETHGASLYLVGADVNVSRCDFVNNTAASGAGLLAEASDLSVRDCRFAQNSASRGGAMNVVGGKAHVTESMFEDNTANLSAGSLYVEEALVFIEDTVFRNNSASEYGGAGHIRVFSSCFFRNLTCLQNTATHGGCFRFLDSSFELNDSLIEGNFAPDDGGGISVMKAPFVKISRSRFRYNSAKQGGGVDILADSTEIRDTIISNNEASVSGAGCCIHKGTFSLLKCTFEDNRVQGDGGGLMCADDAFLTVQNSVFRRNQALNSGGGIDLRRSRLSAENLTLSNNTADESGGGINSVESSSFKLVNVSLTQNTASYGGGLYLRKVSSGSLIGCMAYSNSALTRGGLAYMEEADLTVQGGRLSESRARHGATFSVSDGRLKLEDTAVVNGSRTSAGGGIHADRGSLITVVRSRFLFNSAETGGAINLDRAYLWAREVHFTQCKAMFQGGAINAHVSSSVLCSGCVFEDNVADKNGGAVNVASQKAQQLAYQFDNCTFSNNRGVMGGALHFVSRNRTADCASCDAGSTFVALRGTRFIGNKASAGGAILSSDLNAIRVSCSFKESQGPMRYLTKQEFESLDGLNSLDHICPEWQGNEAEDYGNTLASYACRVRKAIRYGNGDTETVKANRYIVRNQANGKLIPGVELVLLDALGQASAMDIDNETIVATMESLDGLFSCPVKARLENGVGSFSEMRGYGEVGSHYVRISFSKNKVPPFIIIVQISNCKIGEAPEAAAAPAATGTVCAPCNNDTYNFFPDRANAGCVPCPDNAKCDTAVIHPASGYWHQTPCSDRIQQCLTKRACDKINREEGLRQIGESVKECSFTKPFVQRYVDAQCRQGYRGPLCGSCAASYGRSRSFRCEPCRSGYISFAVGLISIIILLVLSAFAIRSSLPAKKSLFSVLEEQKRRASALAKETIQPVSPREVKIPPSGPSLPRLNVQVLEMIRKGHDPREFIQAGQRSVSSSSQTSEHSQETEEDTQLAKLKAVEIFKITINYFQVIAVAISINVDWSEALIWVFETAEFLGGMTSEAIARSADCVISEDSVIPRTVLRTTISILIPMLVTALYFVFWAVAFHHFSESLSYLTKRCVLSFMAVSYLSYIAITKTAINALSCVTVYDSVEPSSDATASYWVADTSVRCYEGSHAVLAKLVGWPVLIVFSLGFPITVAAVLISERRKHSMTSEWLYEATGIMYRAYKTKYVFWESVIMLRKAVLAVVVVLSYALGGNLQGISSVCVLTLSLYFQTVCGPFREEFAELNEYESLSLLVSSLTFASGLFFNDERTLNSVQVLLTVVVILANAGIVILFVTAFFSAANQYVRTVIEVENHDYDAQKGHLHVIWVFLCSRMSAAANFFVPRAMKCPPAVSGVMDSESNV